MANKANQKLYSAVMKSLSPLLKKYDRKTLRWVLNRWITEERKKSSLLKQKAEIEKELAKIK